MLSLPLFGTFDWAVLQALLDARTPAFDAVTHALLGSDIRIGFLAALLLYTWVAPDGTVAGNEPRIVRHVLAIGLAMVACFVARHLVPKQPRPRLMAPDLAFPGVEGLANLADYRSFPSDTACLAAAITTVVVVASPRLGLLAIPWTLLAVGLPRIYVGYHFLSDVLVGLLLGTAVATVTLRTAPVDAPVRALRAWRQQHPALVTLAVVLVAHQIGTMFPLLQQAGAMLRRWL